MYPYIRFLGIALPSYGVCAAIAVFLCSFLAIVKAKRMGAVVEDMIAFLAATLGAVCIFAVGFFIFVTYSPKEIYQYITNFDFSFITNSGLIFYGGLIGGVIGGLVFSRIFKLPITTLEKSLVPYIPLGHAIGRIGCLLAGCCHGFEYEGIFAVENKLSAESVTYFPVQAVEALLNLVIMATLLVYSRKDRKKYSVLICYLGMYAVARFFLEFFRGDDIRGALLNLSTSQWVSLGMLIVCIATGILRMKKANN